jgi:hypothetical protein
MSQRSPLRAHLDDNMMQQLQHALTPAQIGNGGSVPAIRPSSILYDEYAAAAGLRMISNAQSRVSQCLNHARLIRRFDAAAELQ